VGLRVGPFILRGIERGITRKREKKSQEGGQGKEVVTPRSCERAKYLTRGQVKAYGQNLLGPSFLDLKLYKKDYSPSFDLS
jgi:hypothetical protein